MVTGASATRSCRKPGRGATVTCTVPFPVSRPSLAISRSTYTPSPGKVTLVCAPPGLLKETPAGPLTWLHCIEVILWNGSPSSFTMPFSATEVCGSAIVRLKPARTSGVWLPPAVGTPGWGETAGSVEEEARGAREAKREETTLSPETIDAGETMTVIRADALLPSCCAVARRT